MPLYTSRQKDSTRKRPESDRAWASRHIQNRSLCRAYPRTSISRNWQHIWVGFSTSWHFEDHLKPGWSCYNPQESPTGPEVWGDILVGCERAKHGGLILAHWIPPAGH